MRVSRDVLQKSELRDVDRELSPGEQERLARDVLALVAGRLTEEAIGREPICWAMLNLAVDELAESPGRAEVAEALGIAVAGLRAAAGLPPMPGPHAHHLARLGDRVARASNPAERMAVAAELHRLARSLARGTRRRRRRR